MPSAMRNDVILSAEEIKSLQTFVSAVTASFLPATPLSVASVNALDNIVSMFSRILPPSSPMIERDLKSIQKKVNMALGFPEETQQLPKNISKSPSQLMHQSQLSGTSFTSSKTVTNPVKKK